METYGVEWLTMAEVTCGGEAYWLRTYSLRLDPRTAFFLECESFAAHLHKYYE